LDTPPTNDSYFYRVYANCGIKSAFSNVAQMNNVTTKLNPFICQNNLVISVYPNPCNKRTTLNFQLDKKSKVACDIYGLNGKFKKSIFYGEMDQGKQQICIDLLGFQSGVYLCRLKNENNISEVKIVVQNGL
jgi:Secretion system C-terminal sorting domain